jgi:hypothetical protein
VGVLVCAVQLHSSQKQPDLKLKTRPKLLLGYLPLAFRLPIKASAKQLGQIMYKLTGSNVGCVSSVERVTQAAQHLLAFELNCLNKMKT